MVGSQRDRGSITTAVIAAAGSATRMWPTSRTVPKEALPIGRLPAIVHLLKELCDAGIEHTIVVVGSNFDIIFRMLDSEIAVPERFADDKWARDYCAVLDKMKITFCRQRGPYGNATPLVAAIPIVGFESCVYAFSDDIVLGENTTAAMLECYGRTSNPCVAAQVVPASRRSQFGIVECERNGDGDLELRAIFEKPGAGETRSRLAAFGRYVVTPAMMSKLDEVPLGRSGELWFSDLLVAYLETGSTVNVVELRTGIWHTVGDPESYARAVMHGAKLIRR